MGAARAGQDLPTAQIHCVSGEVFKTLGIPLLRGRSFTDYDREGAPKVVIANAAAANLFWPGQDAIGKRVWLGCGWEDNQWGEVVGVAGDVKYGRIEEQVSPGFYLPYLQPVEPASFVLLKSNQDPDSLAVALRKTVKSIDRNLPLYDIQTMEARIAEATSRTKFVTVLLVIFAALAMILSAIGLFGVVSCAVSSRSREIGIRAALGARASQILGSIVGDAAGLLVCGMAFGIAGALLGGKVLSSQLYEISPTDPLTLVVVTSVLIFVGLAACVIPAIRASRIQPAEVLRIE
jgi:predicted permease